MKPKTKKPSKKEYIKTHLRGMDEVKKRWYLNAMKTWTKKDYENYEKATIEMLGPLTKEDRKALKKLKGRIKK